jgi:thiamine kinase-like enzyme
MAIQAENSRGYFPYWVKCEVAEYFHAEPSSFHDFQYLCDGISNSSFKFTFCGGQYVVRFPKSDEDQSEKLFREQRTYSLLLDAGATYTDELLYFDIGKGIKLTRYIVGSRYPDIGDSRDVQRAIRLLRYVHDSGIVTDVKFDLMESFLEDERKLHLDPVEHMPGYAKAREEAIAIYDRLSDHYSPVFNHIDPIKYNFLLTPEKDYLIDFEYSAMTTPMIDLAAFAIYHKFSNEQVNEMLLAYHGREVTEDDRNALYKYLGVEGLFSAIWYLDRLEEGGDMQSNMKDCYACALAYISQNGSK